MNNLLPQYTIRHVSNRMKCRLETFSRHSATLNSIRPRNNVVKRRLPVTRTLNPFLPCEAFFQVRFYGSKSKIEIEEEAFDGMESMKPFIRSCLSDSQVGGEYKALNMEFAIAFLGTGGGAPTMHRGGSCTALRLGGQTFLFDVCEGTLRQMTFTRIAPSTISKIFISHLHGDHLYGLVPVILDIQVNAKVAMNSHRKKKHTMPEGPPTLEIYGPPGLYNFISMTLALSCAKINYLNVIVIELVGGKEERGPSASSQRRGGRNIFLSHYPEIETDLIQRRYLKQVSENFLRITPHVSLERGQSVILY